MRAAFTPRASAASGGSAGDGRRARGRAAKARPAPRRQPDRSPTRKADAPAVSTDAVSLVDTERERTLATSSADPAMASTTTAPRPPVETCQHVHLGAASSVAEALTSIRDGLRGLTEDASAGWGESTGVGSSSTRSMPPFASGVVRLTVAVPRTVDALDWLRALPNDDAALSPRYYLSPRTPPPAIRSGEGDDGEPGTEVNYVINQTNANGKDRPPKVYAEPPEWRADPRGAVGACGAACLWTGEDKFGADVLADMRRFLDTGEPHDTAPRVYGGGRFDADVAHGDEWARFGGHYFFLPTLEVCEGGEGRDGGVLRGLGLGFFWKVFWKRRGVRWIRGGGRRGGDRGGRGVAIRPSHPRRALGLTSRRNDGTKVSARRLGGDWANTGAGPSRVGSYRGWAPARAAGGRGGRECVVGWTRRGWTREGRFGFFSAGSFRRRGFGVESPSCLGGTGRVRGRPVHGRLRRAESEQIWGTAGRRG